MPISTGTATDSPIKKVVGDDLFHQCRALLGHTFIEATKDGLNLGAGTCEPCHIEDVTLRNLIMEVIIKEIVLEPRDE